MEDSGVDDPVGQSEPFFKENPYENRIGTTVRHFANLQQTGSCVQHGDCGGTQHTAKDQRLSQRTVTGLKT
jgi:hypothetical protein